MDSAAIIEGIRVYVSNLAKAQKLELQGGSISSKCVNFFKQHTVNVIERTILVKWTSPISNWLKLN